MFALKHCPTGYWLLSGRTAHLNITVSEDGGDESTYDLCDRVGSEGERETLYVECQQSQRGRYVRLQRHVDGYEARIINICEVQVYGYLYSGEKPFFQDREIRNTIQWRHNEREGISNHWRLDCLLNR